MIFNLMKPVPVQTATMYLYGHEADKTVSYNGVVLPELPVDSDYPRRYIFKAVAGGYFACVTNGEPYVYIASAGSYIIAESTDLYKTYYLPSETGEWSLQREGTAGDHTLAEMNYIYSFSGFSGQELLWCSHDLNKADGTLYMAGNAPVITYENADVTINGVGYVGAVLPKLPNWDKATYPFANIFRDNILGTSISLLVTEQPCIHADGSRKYTVATNSVRYKYNQSENAWVYYEEKEYIADTTYIIAPFWSNFDVLNEDGTTYLEATNPVPFYE